jgi:hypothetical protein
VPCSYRGFQIDRVSRPQRDHTDCEWHTPNWADLHSASRSPRIPLCCLCKLCKKSQDFGTLISAIDPHWSRVARKHAKGRVLSSNFNFWKLLRSLRSRLRDPSGQSNRRPPACSVESLSFQRSCGRGGSQHLELSANACHVGRR